MPRIRQYEAKYARDDFLREIRTKQGAHNLMNIYALSDASGIPYATLRRRLMNPEDFTVGELRKLVPVICLDWKVMLKFIGYSKKMLPEKGGSEDGARVC